MPLPDTDETAQKMADIIHQAVMDSLNPTDMQRLIHEAVAHMLRTTTRYGENRESLIQQAFKRAVEKVAYEVATEYVRENEQFMTAMRTALQGAAALALLKDTEIRESMARAALRIIQKDE